MKKGWRVILGIVLVALIVGGICFGVGILTGADSVRITQNLDEHFRLSAYINAYTNYARELIQYFTQYFRAVIG